jgi:hypothetical protein
MSALLLALMLLFIASIQLYRANTSVDRVYEANLILKTIIVKLQYSREDVSKSIEMLSEGRELCEEALQYYINTAPE